MVCTSIPGTPLTPPAYQYDTGRGGAGYSLGSGTIYCPYLFWTDVGEWPTNEFYVSFWMRYPSRTYPDGDSHWNVKLFYPHWDGVNSYVHYSATGNEGAYYSAHDKNGGTLEQSRWPSTPNDMDGNWHHYEFYINFAQGISRFWYDGVLKIDSNYGAGVWTNNIYYLTFGHMDAEEANVFTRFIDDIEVWDGMPTAEEPTAGDDPVESDSLNPPTGLMVLQ